MRWVVERIPHGKKRSRTCFACRNSRLSIGGATGRSDCLWNHVSRPIQRQTSHKEKELGYKRPPHATFVCPCPQECASKSKKEMAKEWTFYLFGTFIFASAAQRWKFRWAVVLLFSTDLRIAWWFIRMTIDWFVPNPDAPQPWVRETVQLKALVQRLMIYTIHWATPVACFA